MLSHKSLGQWVRARFDDLATQPGFTTNQACNDLSNNRTHLELKQDVDHIQTQLAKIGVRAYDRVSLCTTKSCDSYAALLALVSADVCYIPIDSLAPSFRVGSIIRDSRPKGILIDLDLTDSLPNEFKNVPQHRIHNTELIYLDLGFEQLADVNKELAYILYTSGSTGQPKGVLISHANALSFINWAALNFEFSQADTFASVAPYHFDLSVFDLFVSLYWGAGVVLFNDQHIRNPLLLAQQIEAHGISVWYSTPTILVLMERYGKLGKYTHASLRTVLYAGEILPLTSLKSLGSYWGNASWYNLYGPTETNVCTWAKVSKQVTDNFDVSLIGQPCSHSTAHILSKGNIEPLGVDLEGELLISGDTVSLGYLNNKALTAEKFITCEAGIRWYCTGDQVRVIDGLGLKYLGRLDRMIKKRGYRIELDEVQTALEQCTTIRRAAVIATQDRDQEVNIVAFYETLTSEDLASQSARNHIERRLPNYMWPDRWVCLKSLPLTSTAKIDYQALTSHPALNPSQAPNIKEDT